MSELTRRNLLGTAAAATIAASAEAARAEAPAANAAAPGVYRYKIGSYELTALYDGIWYRPIDDKFIANAPFAEVEQALDAAFMPHDKLATPFTTVIVNTGKRLVLLDTGTGGQIAPSAHTIRSCSGKSRATVCRRVAPRPRRDRRRLRSPRRPCQRGACVASLSA